MGNKLPRWRWLIGSIILLAFAAGCYQQGGVNPEPLSPLEPGPTNTLPVVETPFPTPEPPTNTPFVPTQEPLEPQGAPTDSAPLGFEPIVEPTVEGPDFAQVPTTDFFGSQPDAAALPTLDIFNNAGAAPTADPFAAPGIAQLPTEDTGLFQEQVPAQQPPIDPPFLTATEVIRRATATSAAELTATAISAGVGIPTFTPFPSLTVAVPTQGVPSAPGTDCVHEVRAGENLFRISQNYGLPLNTVAQYNNIANPSLILVGQRITIPNCGNTGQLPPATSTPLPGQTPGIPAPGGGTGACGPVYTVQQGDTLFKISLRCGVPVNSIAAANGISNINLILINQQLTIPAS